MSEFGWILINKGGDKTLATRSEFKNGEERPKLTGFFFSKYFCHSNQQPSPTPFLLRNAENSSSEAQTPRPQTPK
jgi:hypothetical protein